MKFPDEVKPKFPDSLEPMLSDFAENTVAWVIQRFIDKMAGSRTKPIGKSQFCTLRVIQRMKLGRKNAFKLDEQDVIEFCEALIDQGKNAATVKQYFSYFRGALKYAKSAFRDCKELPLAAFTDAQPFLNKNNLIGKSRPRDIRPTTNQWDALIEYFRKAEQDKRNEIPMSEIMEFQVWSARRIGETCRLKCADVNVKDRTCIVRDMKDPRHKKGNDHEFPLLGRAWEIVERRMKEWDGQNGNTRIFPYNAQSVSAKFTRAKHVLKIKNLRLHDLRREAASRAFEKGFSTPEVMILTGHKTPALLMRVYTKLKASDLHKGPAAQRASP